MRSCGSKLEPCRPQFSFLLSRSYYMKRKIIKLLRGATWLLLIAMTACFLWMWRSAGQVPDYYAAALLVSPEELAESGDVMKQELMQLEQDVHLEGDWQAVFSDEDINGWLAVEMPKQYRGLLPSQLTRPCVDLDPGRINLAAQYAGHRLRSVVNLTASIAMNESDDLMRLTLLDARAGELSVPVASLKKYFERAAAKLKVSIRWEEDAAKNQVAVVSIPRPPSLDEFDVRIDRVELQDGRCVVYGRTRRADSFMDWLNDKRHRSSLSKMKSAMPDQRFPSR